MTRGRFITFEGGEGVGKSTHALRLTESLRLAGHDVVATREPGGAPGAEEIRALLVTGATDRWDPMTEALLHFAARREHIRRTVEPALAAGRWVLSDRFADSTLAYQGYGHGLDRERIERLCDLVVGGLVPDLTIVLEVPLMAGLERAAGRNGTTGLSATAARPEDRYERMDTGFHCRVRDGFRDIARRDPARCVIVDAGGEVATVAAAIRATISERLGIDL